MWQINELQSRELCSKECLDEGPGKSLKKRALNIPVNCSCLSSLSSFQKCMLFYLRGREESNERVRKHPSMVKGPHGRMWAKSGSQELKPSGEWHGMELLERLLLPSTIYSSTQLESGPGARNQSPALKRGTQTSSLLGQTPGALRLFFKLACTPGCLMIRLHSLQHASCGSPILVLHGHLHSRAGLRMHPLHN